MNRTKMFPLQSDYRNPKPHPTSIPWEVADKAYSVYRAKYGAQQTLERLAERGGFSAGEMDMFHPSWREEVDGITARNARIVALEAELAAVTKERDERASEAALVRISNKALQRDLQEMTRERDEQAEAKRVLAKAASLGYTLSLYKASELVEATMNECQAMQDAYAVVLANFLAAAAVKESY